MSLETMTKLLTYTVSASGGDSSVTFSNIPQEYTDLVVKVSARDTNNNGGMYMRLNGTTTGYTAKGLYGSGSSASGEALTNSALLITPSGNTAGIYGNLEVVISNYSGNTYKSILADGVSENNASSTYMEFFSEIWSNSSPVTSLVFSAVSGNLAQHSSFTLYGVKNARKTAGNSIKATGGNIVFDGTYVYHVFNTTSAFTPTQSLTADVLVVAGGGGGGSQGGGGGAGGLRAFANQSLSATNYSVTVGGGGAGSTNTSNKGVSGNNSTFNTSSTTGGGGGGSRFSGSGSNGGSGGGSAFAQTAGSGNSGGYSPVEGYAGGGSTSSGAESAGGGGGASAVGASGSGTVSGAGGSGTQTYNSIDFSTWLSTCGVGVSNYIAGGGGGSGYLNTVAGTGGSGGGGAGGLAAVGANATAYSGSGGGGGGAIAGTSYNGGNGGSGIVIVRYKG